MTTYCRPPNSYVIGVAFQRAEVASQSSLPVLCQGAELVVEVGGRDEDQSARGHDRSAIVLGSGALHALRRESGYSPSGIFQAYSPVFRLIASSVPHGGAMAGYHPGRATHDSR